MSSEVIDVHRKWLNEHRFMEYDSVAEYFEEEIGFDDSHQRYQNISLKSIFRLTSYAPRDYVILQNNPNLEKNEHKESVHPSFEKLGGGDDSDICELIAHSRTRIAKYLFKKGGQELKFLLHAIDEYSNGGLSTSSVIDQRSFEHYLRLDTARQYCPESNACTIGPNEGFFSDFAYTNVRKYQAPSGKADAEDYDENWLEAELASISPDLILAMGTTAMEAIDNICFEKIKCCEYSCKKEGRVYEYEGDKDSLVDTRAIGLYHLNYHNSNYGYVIHDALNSVC